MSPVRIGRVAVSRYIVALAVIAIAAYLSAGVGYARRFEDDTAFRPSALDPERSYFSQLPFEHIDS
jgi:hypothetical protein